MATKYSDFVKIRPGKPAYSIENEAGDEWTSFIPNDQFNAVLQTVLRSVRNNDIDFHKSFWINGTYGTGKTHAAAVITHLLCDPIEDIRQWVDYEYGDERHRPLREAIYAARARKRLMRVSLEGLSNIAHVTELAPKVQTAVVEALNRNDIEMDVDTDYDTMMQNVKEHPVVWDDLISRHAALNTIVADRDMLLRKLRAKDSATLQKAKEALRDAGFSVMLPQESLPLWLAQVEQGLKAEGTFQGMIIVWDEFTDVMMDAVGIGVLKELQTVAQRFMNADSDSYLFLISHPSAFNNLGTEATRQTDGRYHRMKYNMESVSAFKIMSRKLKITDEEKHQRARDFFYTMNDSLLSIFIHKSNDPAQTRDDLLRLYPLHPGTANLATHYATVVGSSSRSVFEFLGQNTAIRDFLDSEEHYAARDTITADYLWDFVESVLRDDVAAYGAVTERFNTYRHQVEHEGPAYLAIFKGILLLNAFNNVAADPSVTPSEENIINLFAGSRYDDEVMAVLEWFNDRGIIQRDPSGVYSVQFSALPSHELEEIKDALVGSEYRYTSQVLRFGDTARGIFEKRYAQTVIRPYVFDFFSAEANDSAVKHRIKVLKREARPSDLALALLYGRDNAEMAHLRQLAEQCSAESETDKELRDVVFIVVDTPFGEKAYPRFIEYMASYKAAGNHGFNDQANVHREHAVEMIKEWMQAAARGNASVHVNGHMMQISLKHLSSTLNREVAPIIFPLGPDSLPAYRAGTAGTFWKPQVSKEIIRTFLFATSKQDLMTLKGPMRPVQHLVQDALDEELEFKPDIPEGHQFKAIFDFVNSTIRNFISHGNTSVPFDFTERFRPLTEPPFGLSANYASEAAMAFALRPWIDKIYDRDTGKPRSADLLTDDIARLFSFWAGGKNAGKLSFRFQTPQEGKICSELVKLFKLTRQQGYNEVASMKDARFTIIGQYLQRRGYPLWTLKYLTDDFINTTPRLTMNADMRQLIDNITAICMGQDINNVQLRTSTLDLIGRYRTDFPDILSKPGQFQNGFENFLMQQQSVGLRPEEMEAATEYIRQHLQSDVGYWTEAEVSDKLKDWRIAEAQQAEAARREREEQERRERESAERQRLDEERQRIQAETEQLRKLIGDPAAAEAKKDAARARINSIEAAEALRQILDRIIDMGLESVLDKIIDQSPSDV